MNEQEYLNKQKNIFESTHDGMTILNHKQHNDDPEYWNILLKEIKQDKEKWKNKTALDFGCGCGRNLKNLLDLAEWARVDGCDISLKNAEYAKKWTSQYYQSDKIHTWETNGKDIQPCKNETYDFIMSHIVFQHIASYSIRFSIMEDLYRCLKVGGFISLHFLDLTESNSYFEDSFINRNCVVENKEYLIHDFKKIGFKNIECIEGRDFFIKQNKTYYIKGYKL